jgi:hypothetical protein
MREEDVLDPETNKITKKKVKIEFDPESQIISDFVDV